jgi:hypothetical protein
MHRIRSMAGRRPQQQATTRLSSKVNLCLRSAPLTVPPGAPRTAPRCAHTAIVQDLRPPSISGPKHHIPFVRSTNIFNRAHRAPAPVGRPRP